MAAIQVQCSNCGARYKLLRRPPQNRVKCRKCGAVITLEPGADGRTAEDWTGREFGGYRLLELISRGDLVDVYRAEQVAMRRMVAVAVLRSEHAEDPATVEAFVAGARLVAAMQSPNIISIYDVNAGSLPCYFSMEYVEGSTVREMLDTMGTPPPADAVRVAATVGSALTHALRHGAGAFRVAPDTVMLTNKGEVKILPEAFPAGSEKGRESGESQAIRQLGALLYVMLTGIDVGNAKKAPPPSEHKADISAALDRAVLQMLKGQKGYSSLVAATTELKHLSGRPRRVASTAEHTVRHVHHQQKTRSRKAVVITLLLMAVCGATVAGLAFYLLRQGDIAGCLNKISIAESEEDDEGFVAYAEEFIQKYPSHPSVAELKRKVERKKEALAKKRREEEAQTKVGEALEDAERAPHRVSAHVSALEALKEKYADVEGFDRLIERSKQRVLAIWNSQRDVDRQEVEQTVRKRRFGLAYEKIDELHKKYAGDDPEDRKRVEDHIKTLKMLVDKTANDEFIRFTNYAFTYQAGGKVDKAIELFQSVVDNWGVEKYAELARQQIERLKQAPPPTPENERPAQEAPPGEDTEAINRGL